MTKKEIAKFIDHTLLAPQATEEQIIKLCQEAERYDFASVCINPCYVKLASEQLKSSDVKICTVIGFPLGATTPDVKAFEALDAIKNGADEVDMVINVGAAKNGKFDVVESDIKAVVDAAKQGSEETNKKVIVKVILETCFLTDTEIVKACIASKNAGADFVKTSTGFANPKTNDGQLLPNGASVHHVEIMRKAVGPEMGVKASGGIRTVAMTAELIEAGANRIGTSSGAIIVQGWIEN